MRTPGEICVHAQKLVKALHMQRRLLHRLAAARAAVFPPHRALWECISKYEGAPTSVNPNGHYGMLQMHWNWGYGIVGAASSYTKAEQEWAAERAYAAAGYSTSFLFGQWFDYDNAAGDCLRLA